MLVGGKQYVTFIEPHGLLHEGPASEKILFQGHVKEVEKQLHDPDVILNSFILSWTRYPQLKWGNTQKELEDKHVLFMTECPRSLHRQVVHETQGEYKIINKENRNAVPMR